MRLRGDGQEGGRADDGVTGGGRERGRERETQRERERERGREKLGTSDALGVRGLPAVDGLAVGAYRGTGLIRPHPFVGHYSSPMRRDLW